MAKSKDPGNYEVGYGKPPKHTQWQSGQSGNAKGKPRKNKTLEEEVQAIFAMRVPVIINHKKTYVTKRQLLLEQIINGAINKNTTMMRLAIPLLKLAAEIPEFEVLPEDEKALASLLASIGEDKEQKS
jgi:hypothetical protein